ncbi:hypothetical protein [Nonomuraea lactucae]|uniref:hypothetical protein n=1 Tax=Nonomuraea lactucae TaxID=2249762 RepID=UPI000DE2B15B|nr:hypothetical protein [Nonomuraea lactucae]
MGFSLLSLFLVIALWVLSIVLAMLPLGERRLRARSSEATGKGKMKWAAVDYARLVYLAVYIAGSTTVVVYLNGQDAGQLSLYLMIFAPGIVIAVIRLITHIHLAVSGRGGKKS